MDISAYLRRLGLEAAPPSLDLLKALHVAHIERVPYEALEIWLGRPTTVDPAESAARIARGRGGYCFHLNGAFSLLLESLGYQVTRHVGGVHSHGAEPAITANHLALTVRLPEGDWLVDLGLGDALHEPLPLAEGRYRQGPFEYGLRPSTVAPGGWHFDHDPRGSFAGMDFGMEPAHMSAFEQMHGHLTTSPESGFVRVATVARRDATGVDIMRGLVLTRVEAETGATTMETSADYFQALDDVFGLRFDAGERALLWDKVSRAHAAWTASASTSSTGDALTPSTSSVSE
ncbi:arylamine N-acetyltransferase family protein [Nonomuraea africana]|uniref:Arylamine N-acetyltransferase n=1 Tax=Nonomuraea africana TaxID=46171 RepID=A0ABR9KV22_9ACTN|nr:arylamine N-acetyltransferase [Nonomuraea africana]MBE1565882.1 arylamine N-acetyltransferase [Nonomuraea africana]